MELRWPTRTAECISVMTSTGSMPNCRQHWRRAIRTRSPVLLPVANPAHIDVDEIRTCVIAYSASMQGDCSVSQSRGGNAGDPDINCHRLHVEALSGHAVSVSAEELIAPGCAIATDNIDLEIRIAERGSQIVQQVEHPRIICANITGTVIPQIMVEPLKRFLIVSPAIAVDDVPLKMIVAGCTCTSSTGMADRKSTRLNSSHLG